MAIWKPITPGCSEPTMRCIRPRTVAVTAWWSAAQWPEETARQKAEVTRQEYTSACTMKGGTPDEITKSLCCTPLSQVPQSNFLRRSDRRRLRGERARKLV